MLPVFNETKRSGIKVREFLKFIINAAQFICNIYTSVPERTKLHEDSGALLWQARVGSWFYELYREPISEIIKGSSRAAHFEETEPRKSEQKKP